MSLSPSAMIPSVLWVGFDNGVARTAFENGVQPMVNNMVQSIGALPTSASTANVTFSNTSQEYFTGVLPQALYLGALYSTCSASIQSVAAGLTSYVTGPAPVTSFTAVIGGTTYSYSGDTSPMARAGMENPPGSSIARAMFLAAEHPAVLMELEELAEKLLKKYC